MHCIETARNQTQQFKWQRQNALMFIANVDVPIRFGVFVQGQLMLLNQIHNTIPSKVQSFEIVCVCNY